MPVFDVCKAEPRRDHRRQTSLASSFDVTSTTTGTTTTTSSSSLRPISSFEVLFSRLLDMLIFTSAIAITAYSYLTGTLFSSSLVESSASTTTTSSSTPTASTPIHHHKIQYKPPYKYEEPDLIKKRRIQEWTQEQKLTYTKKRHSSTSLLENKKVQLPRNTKRDKKRTQSLSSLSIDRQPEEILLSRMEERLQSLIQQGQEALLSPVKYNK
ncbi:hypothetical protein G6F70_000570 [Rhizopus microsporus]|uniref:Uncharacterized protein n=2 Tax=Rhizopus TaxID=4842 RepID=A0A367KHC3_RHIAZ|nr:hypothetical protein G6F71_000082 [Rhizopus microsporus]RCI01530.1 hypothetical protein CU097_015881 [Rhizopus azygosporus]KAG1204353.1 hypothetical protein G6F70_000570 [Rhizopus microsporus]KAG1215779.1 hypothetical protein G6F69_000678 [Rhizopus microsporus]KAG1238311.1 hypothetical protein G6F67_000504 [Rhizopus microsporus]